MFFTSGQISLASRGLTVLRGVGAWVAINPDQTYVATSIPGLGTCKSTYCPPVRRDIARQAHKARTLPTAPLLALLAVTAGILSGCAWYRPMADLRDVTERGQSERDLADCQNYAEPVSPGAMLETVALMDSVRALEAANQVQAPEVATPARGAIGQGRITPTCNPARDYAVVG